ncbi:MAG: AAA family ATPase [Chitinivibrionales bacterium]|nr:AAA family ATPase [Chitinivibrionales bacterium]
MFKRIINLELLKEESGFLWGPRQSGKSTLLRNCFPQARYYDLLLSPQYRRLLQNPEILRQECENAGLNGENQGQPVVIDEIQKIPELLNEVHWLIENRGLRFLLCGSSARKVRRGHANLLGGRAVRFELFALVFPEIPDLNLEQALNAGLLPRHYQSKHWQRLLQAYIGDYLQEEIAAESLTRNLPAFSRFLEVAAQSCGEIVNYANIASECGVSAPTVRGYYEIAQDTLIGSFLPAYRKRAKRRQILAPKFYLFDTGVTGFLAKQGRLLQGSEMFGKAFEQYIVHEVRSHSSYSEKFYPVSYWKSASGIEVDLVLGDNEIAIEIKSSDMIRPRHLKGLRAIKEEYAVGRALAVSLDPSPRTTEDGIEIVPWRHFLEQLWSGGIL